MKKWQNNRFFQLACDAHRENHLIILELLNDIKGERLLDIGCGNGNFTLQCGQQTSAEELYGIEIKETVAKEAEAKGIKVFIQDAGSKYDFPEEYFNVITANQVLEHVLDADNMLRECHRTLKSTGTMILSVPNLCSLMGKLLILLGRQSTTLHVSEIQVGNFLRGTETSGHIHAFAPVAVKDLVEYHGFKIEKMIGVGYYPFRPSKVSRFLSILDKRHAVYLTMELTKSET